ncbi:universal stress protein YxiE-like isoform X2 [Lineus longissimus]
MGDRRLVLVAVDSSAQAERAFQFYIDNLHRPENDILFYHVAEKPNLPTVSLKDPMSFPADDWHKELTKRNEDVNALEGKYEILRTSKQMKGEFLTVYEDRSNPGEAIVSAAEGKNAAMIVVGTRGLGTLRRTILGSVSDYVVHHAKCTVIICPPGKTD